MQPAPRARKCFDQDGYLGPGGRDRRRIARGNPAGGCAHRRRLRSVAAQQRVSRDIVRPLDLEQRFDITEGNIFHGDIYLDQLFFLRPLPGWSRYATPIEGLHLCGAATHPGGGVTGAPGYCAARVIAG